MYTKNIDKHSKKHKIKKIYFMHFAMTSKFTTVLPALAAATLTISSQAPAAESRLQEIAEIPQIRQLMESWQKVFAENGNQCLGATITIRFDRRGEVNTQRGAANLLCRKGVRQSDIIPDQIPPLVDKILRDNKLLGPKDCGAITFDMRLKAGRIRAFSIIICQR